ncbi:MAG: tetratricopeptide repeat protein [Actinomycetota bacterium]|nr:tetratricopeptide repeat protein [Actinomycetota bacterium]
MAQEPLDTASSQPALDPDPIAKWLRSVAAMLVVVLLVTTLSFMLYIRSIDTPRTAQERDIERYRTAVADDPDNQLNHVFLAYAYAQADRYEDAMKSIEKAYIISDNALVGIAEADVLRLSGQLDEAVTAYDRVRPKVERAYQSTLLELRKQNIGSEPPDTQMQQLLTGRGLALREQGSYEDALQDFEAALAIAPTDATLLVAIGETHAAMSNVASATVSFQAALRFIPEMPEALIGLRDIGLSPDVQGRP